MRHQLEDALEDKRELLEAQQDCSPRQSEVLGELEEMLAAERAQMAALKAEMIVSQNNHASDLQAAHHR